MVCCITVVAAILLNACAQATTSPPAGSEGIRLIEVVDGDTIVARFPNGTEERIRLLGIDTPETVDPTRPVQCYGNEASVALTTILPEGALLRLERDVEARDRFGRLLAYVYRAEDGLFVNAMMLSEGFADLSIYEPNVAHREELTDAMMSARTAAVGLWGICGGADVPLDPDEYQPPG